LGGADGITVHLREDRRHIQDRDLRILKETVAIKLNLEMACVDEIVDIACKTLPEQISLVPERREEVTTEGGLDVVGNRALVERTVKRLQDSGIVVSLFLDADRAQLDAAAELGAEAVELHTGQYALAKPGPDQDRELAILAEGARQIVDAGMRLHAGHGLTYHNVIPVASIDGMQELNIGHSIIARAVFVGLERAVYDMRQLMNSVEFRK
jgi:pyridoxine 5-phosphate synthase